MQINNLYTTDSIAPSWFNIDSYKIPVTLIILYTATTILRPPKGGNYINLSNISNTVWYLTGFIEIMLMQFITSSIQEKFKHINKNFRKMTLLLTLNTQKNVKGVEDHNKRNAQETDRLIHEHCFLATIANKAVQVFGIPILIILVLNFQQLTMLVYADLSLFKVGEIKKFVVNTLVTVYYFGQVYLLVRAWDSLAKEVSKTIYYYTTYSQR